MSGRARFCPRCGKRAPHRSRIAAWFAGGAFSVVVILIVYTRKPVDGNGTPSASMPMESEAATQEHVTATSGSHTNAQTNTLSPPLMPAVDPTDPSKKVGSVVYVCDASGSMIGKFDLLKYELRKAIGSLDAIQTFDVIFFHEGGGSDTGRGRLLMANSANKHRTYQFIDEYSLSPGSDPIPCLQLAFKLKPELIYLVTDGGLNNFETILNEFSRLNARQQISVNTVLFGQGENPNAEDALRAIAEENGGTFQMVGMNAP